MSELAGGCDHHGMLIGEHVNIGGKTLIETLEESRGRGSTCAQIFTKSPRTFGHKSRFTDEDCLQVKSWSKKNSFPIVIHGSYLINLAIPTELMIDSLVEDLHLATKMGAQGVVIHMGKHLNKMPIEEAVANFRKNICSTIDKARVGVRGLRKVILETPAGQGTELFGNNLNDFIDFCRSFPSKYRPYIGVCLDTCHIWASGTTLEDALSAVHTAGLEITTIHINDSKNDRGDQVDRHETIGEGKIPDRSIAKFVAEFCHKIPCVLETPDLDKREKEIEWLCKSCKSTR
jgi:deoxyribonuclease-4